MKDQQPTMSPGFDPMAMMFSAPIPGQSLTSPVGAAPYELPPQYADPGQALESLFDQLVVPRNTAKVLALLEAGARAEEITKTLLFSWFKAGKITPDVALLMGKIVLTMIVAIGVRHHVPNMHELVLKPDTETIDFLAKLEPLEKKYKITPAEQAAALKEVKAVKASSKLGGLLDKLSMSSETEGLV